MKTLITLILLLLVSYSIADVVTKEQHPNLGRVPEPLKKVRSVFRAQLVGAGFIIYSAPRPEDPQDAVYREERFAEVFYQKGDQIDLSESLEDFLEEFDPGRTLDVTLLQPYILIALGTDGSKWLISVRRQDSQTEIVPLRALGDQPPFDQVFWPYLGSGYYLSDAPRLQARLRSFDMQASKSEPQSETHPRPPAAPDGNSR